MVKSRSCRLSLNHVALVALTLMIPLLCLALIFAPFGSKSLGPVSDLHITNSKVSPDGYTRSAVLAGGLFPGPVITGFKGDTFRINVSAQLTDKSMLKTTSVHWHGINLNGYNWADGTVGITQCPIAPGNSFLYEFNVPDQVGTYWYHSHVASQHCDGLRGPFVIYDKEDPYKYLYDVDDESTIITLSDWYHLPSPSYGSTPVPDSTLINGLGRYEGGPNSTLAIVKVEYGKRYRFRLISMSCNPSYTFSIDGHMFTIIEADGEYTEPLLVDSLEVLAGQRYSFILNATMPASHYWIRANPSVGTTGFRNGLNSAILRYVGAPGAGVPPELSINATSLKPMMEMDLHPLYNPRPPGEPSIDGADVDLTLTLGYDNKTEKFTVNGQSMAAPSVPVLLQILNGNTPPIDEVAAIYTLPANKTIQITFEADNVPGGPHPWHLHGHTFSVIRGVNASEYNFENPVRRDTVSTGGVGDRVTIRWRTDSSGPWLFHCHIDRHTDTGMGVIFIEDTEGIAQKNSVSNEWKNLCPPYEQLKDEDVGGVPTTTFTPTSSVASTTSSTASSSSSALVSASVSLSLDPLGLDDGIGLDLNANIDLAGIGLKRSRRRRRHHHGWNTF